MTVSTVIGIDPGLTGGIALLRDGEAPWIWDMPVSNGEVDRLTMANILTYATKDDPGLPRAFVEHVHARPRGHIASFKLACAFADARTVCDMLGFKVEYVLPRDWKQAMGVIAPKGATDTERKRLSLDKARELYPQAELHLAKHHGRADALLIAEYARRAL